MQWNKRLSVFALLIFSMVVAAGFVLSPAIGGQKKEPTECEKACKKAHNACRQVQGANIADCKKVYDGCLESCKTELASPEPTVDPEDQTAKPSPTVSPSPEATPIPSPETTPSPGASPVPSPSPEITPSPSPTASPSPEMTPSPSPVHFS